MADSSAARRRQEANGVGAIAPVQGLELLAQMLGGGFPAQVGVFPVDWSRFLQQFHGSVPTFFESLSGASAERPVAARVESAGDLAAFVRGQLAAVLGESDPARIPARRGFFEMGMDSLMTVELVNRLQAALGMRLPANLAIDYPHLDALTGYLSDRMATTSAPVAASAGVNELDALSTEDLARLLENELEAD
jgi:acyl carrier protein